MQAPKRDVLLMGCLYVLFSSTMMICNKGALKVFPFPLQLTAFQYLISAAAVCVLASLSILEAEGLKKEKVQQFWLVSAVFTLAIFSNTRVLHVASVETVIVFRTTVALLTSVGDWVWLNKELPSTQSWVALLTIVGGAAGYMISEGGSLTSDSIVWGSIYVLVLAFEMLYVKHVVTEVKMTTWTRVYYNNILSLGMNMPLILAAQATSSSAYGLALGSALPPAVRNIESPWIEVVSLVMLSAVGGLGISYAGFGFRSLVSATTFTLVGIMCKVATVIMSQLFFANTASLRGVACLCLCVAGATLYRPAPDRQAPGNIK